MLSELMLRAFQLAQLYPVRHWRCAWNLFKSSRYSLLCLGFIRGRGESSRLMWLLLSTMKLL
jgi:hypothetical protein